ncbi:DUF3307 domain-containing protein [Hujiaoplasma nucleasis]|uniref:DUF3307 domain-containing protein n=1 Tax=Hujiaoplasma nucleasis TaxID=2725268 RepID=A0A7L6N5N9_9MOLU|nr:DUF3307 domain-containing protein [Hujiaoplasma nucleasis]QLY39814.1 DUF3307 domain-containing protein [Hujiaoplasma nucleasis]
MFHLLLMFHLIGDFIIQNDNDVATRSNKPFIGSVLHALKTYVSYIVMLTVFWLIVNPGNFELLFVYVLKLGILALMHFLIDLFKSYFVKIKTKIPYVKNIKNEKFNIWILIYDQLVHVFSILLLLELFIIDDISTIDQQIIIIVNAVLIATFFGHEFIKLSMNCILKEYVHDENFKLAKYIGILERLLITPTIIIGVYEVLIVVLGLKVFSDFKREESKIINRNAFIIGNLLSLLMVFIGILYYYTFMELL